MTIQASVHSQIHVSALGQLTNFLTDWCLGENRHQYNVQTHTHSLCLFSAHNAMPTLHMLCPDPCAGVSAKLWGSKRGSPSGLAQAWTCGRALARTAPLPCMFCGQTCCSKDGGRLWQVQGCAPENAAHTFLQLLAQTKEVCPS